MSHFNSAQREMIEECLKAGKNFAEIARKVGSDRTTVAREVRKHALDSHKVHPLRIKNCCVHRSECKLKHACSFCDRGVHQPNRFCKHCAKCNERCREFEEERCDLLSRPPYVCNGCGNEFKCPLHKQYYIAKEAQKAYTELLHSCREGAAITNEERNELGCLLHEKLNKGLSLHHIMKAHPDLFRHCEATLYKYLRDGTLSPRSGRYDLPLAPTMKPRRKRSVQHKVDPRCNDGRRYDDYLAFIKANPDIAVVQMDSVEGKKGGRVLLTLLLPGSSLMLAYLRENNNSQSVIEVLDGLEEILTLPVFQKLFPVILTDNGSEFSNPQRLETSPVTGERRTRIFYCDPYCAWEKGRIESNHRTLRRIFPKGEDMEQVDREKIPFALSNLNSFLRQELGDKPAIEIFETMHGKGILEKLGIKRIPPEDVELTPDIVRA